MVQEVERRIQELVNREEGYRDWLFRHFSESEINRLDDYFSWRDFALDLLMRNPTEEEIARVGYINDKLYRLSRECFEQSRNLARTLRETPYKVDDCCLYYVTGMLCFAYSDENSVMTKPNDAHYASDFQYMIRLKERLVCLEPKETSSIIPNFGMDEGDDFAEKYWKDLDNGTSWAEGYLLNHAYDKYCICYALHALHTHSRSYCLPDILRMNNFKVQVRLLYDRDECDFSDDSSDWHKDLSGRSQDG